ncbi:hypothetical protein COT68_00015 [bacterium (Candidatus Torokbacteria) CG09_land_8_20_14_0_10_42_11]|nr:MAG: hypothetical protein COT68_00015 [bacterium (Candidatus Torokbacteria) CG09_land_8_20_14_0_10_42_11]
MGVKYKDMHIPGEVLIKPRIAPRFFSGLIIGKESKIKPEDMASIIEGIRKKRLPIYDIRGEQIWPVRKKREEIEKENVNGREQ